MPVLLDTRARLECQIPVWSVFRTSSFVPSTAIFHYSLSTRQGPAYAAYHHQQQNPASGERRKQDCIVLVVVGPLQNRSELCAVVDD